MITAETRCTLYMKRSKQYPVRNYKIDSNSDMATEKHNANVKRYKTWVFSGLAHGGALG